MITNWPFQTPSKKFKGDSRYTGSDNEDEDDYSDFTMNKGFIQYSTIDDLYLFYFVYKQKTLFLTLFTYSV